MFLAARRSGWFVAAAAVFLSCGDLIAEVINYQGQLRVDGAAPTGTGQFKFAIINDQGMPVWRSNEMTLPISNGVYNVRLGDTAAAMPDIASGLLTSGARLRVWFNDRSSGWQQAGGDVPLASNPSAGPGAMANSQAEAILSELREIKTLLARQSPAARAPAPGPVPHAEPQIVTIPINDGPSLGKADAPIVLVEFTDFQCGFCKKFHDETFPALKKTFVDTGKVRVLTRNLPLNFHPQAEPAARAGFCANQQKKFWPMREALFKISASLSPEAIENAAKEAGLDLDAFRKCIEKPETKAAITVDGNVAQAAAIGGTPTFVLGKIDNGKVTGVKIVGAQSQAAFEAEINKALSSIKAPVKTASKIDGQ